LLANAEQETYLRDLLSRRLAIAGHFEITDVTNRYALLRLIGPDAPVWIDLAQSIDPDSAVPVAVGEPTDFDRSMCCRAWDDDWSSTKFLLLSSESAPDFVRQLEAAAQRSFHWGGFFAEESFRIRNAIPAFGAELVPYAQVRLGDFSCLAEFAGDAANTGAPHRSVFGEIACPLAPGIHDSPVFAGAEVVGRLTSATAVSIAASRVMARIRSGNFDSVLSVVLGGTEWEIQRMPHCENQ
jgi:hypothetical protein